VLTVQPFDTEEEAIVMANSTPYGLASRIQTTNLARAQRVAAQLDAGIVWVNDWAMLDPAVPFGGVKASGSGRDYGPRGSRRTPVTSPSSPRSAEPDTLEELAMTATQAAVVESGGAPFTLSDVELADPQAHEVLVRMVAAGLCHTDLGVANGGLPFPLPGVLGHEGAGVVEEVGSSVTRVKPGDQVLLSLTSCGECQNCRDGHPGYCATWLPDNLIGGRRPDGSATISRDDEPLGGHFFGQSSYARVAVVDECSLVKVDPDAPLELPAPLGCGIQTGAGAVWNVLKPRPGSAVVVLGAGAVGLSAVMAAALTPATTIIAVDKVASRLDLAIGLGATHVVDVTTDDLFTSVTEITGGGADGVVETTGSGAVLRQGVDALAARGTVVVVGAPPFGTEVALDVNGMLAGKQVVGLTLGDSETQTLIPALVDLVRTGRMPIGRLVQEYPFADIGQAVADVAAGSMIKPVLRF
jgi:aryl-alcohol dehydrogenase